MSRRKQQNPKPLLKSECNDDAPNDMTLDEENVDLCNHDSRETKIEQNTTDASTSKCCNINPEYLGLKSLDEADESNDSRTVNLKLNSFMAPDLGLNLASKNLHIRNEAGIIREEEKKTSTEESISTNNLYNISSQKVKVFMCIPCGIGFSSVSTLEAHQAYYCSHRDDTEEDPQLNTGTSTDKKNSGEPSSKSFTVTKQYACLQCSYSADKKVSLNRHMRMHQISPAPSSNASNGEENSSQNVDRYCSECDIKFSNTKTFRAHKRHYCNSRRNEMSTTPSNSNKIHNSSPERRSNSPQPNRLLPPFLALPTYPILIIPYSLVQSASIISDPLTILYSGSNVGTCFSLENGALKTLATALPNQSTTENSTICQKAEDVTATKSESLDRTKKLINRDSRKKSFRENCTRETIPLDLSLRRTPKSKNQQRNKLVDNKVMDIDSFIEGKENLANNQECPTPEHIICAPSLPNSPPLSPSPKRRILSPQIEANISTLGIDSLERLPLTSVLKADIESKLIDSNVIPLISQTNLELALKLSAENKLNNTTNLLSNSSCLPTTGSTSKPINSSPQIYVKQGVSKCKECNIVFCKHENYLVHKQHYCSARNLMDTSKDKTSAITHSKEDISSSSIAYQQLICAACGIKYTSLDNLRAHQSFYCPKAGDTSSSNISIEKEICENCNSCHDIKTPCLVNPPTTYKCPICDIITMSAADNQKHMESHENIKVFRCSVCRYKGNTLRGMRTHIRMHFDKKNSEFNEENYMSCIIEEDGMEITTTSMDQDNNPSQQLFNCDICNYSSSYKGNVIRHMKLVHQKEDLEDMDNTSGYEKSNITTHQNMGNISENIKVEPLELHNSNQIIEECDDQTEYITETIRTTQPLEDDTSQKSTAQKYCETCDIKFNYMKTFIAHKQFYCKSKQNENTIHSSIAVQSPLLLNRNKENLETVI